ncbi:MAG: cell wall metabolism sensor histidine kinase WalK, partial [Candidatus Omnitrophica bacterium]|nr:cell wall metabolism sensor histidine kinase WalK [Candidatus Omnitrophota bacterium]
MDFIITVYVITIFSSIVIAFLLVRLSRSTGQPKTGAKRPMKEERFTPSDTFAHGSLKESIFEEIKEEVFPKERCEEVSEDLSDIFTREFKKHTDLTKQEFDKKHKSLIEDVEVSWKKYKKVLTDQKETEAVVRGVAEGLVVLDSGGKVIMMNSAAEGLLGISKKDIIGKPILESLKTELLISLVKSSSDKGAKEIEIVSQNDETKRVLRSSNAVLEDENGKTVGIISILNDITKQKNLDQMKSNFVSTVTHELRTPLIATQKAISML